MSFEKNITRLEEIVGVLEKNELPLDEMITVFGEGVELSKACTKQLTEAEGKVVLLVKSGAGIESVPFEDDD